MIVLDSIHETCITLPCASDVTEGTLCDFAADNKVVKAASGTFPKGVVKYVRNGKATVQIHGLATIPVDTSYYYASGLVGLAVNSTADKLEKNTAADKVLVYHSDNTNGYVTVWLG